MVKQETCNYVCCWKRLVMVFFDRRRTGSPMPSALNTRCNKYGKISSFGFLFTQWIAIQKRHVMYAEYKPDDYGHIPVLRCISQAGCWRWQLGYEIRNQMCIILYFTGQRWGGFTACAHAAVPVVTGLQSLVSITHHLGAGPDNHLSQVTQRGTELSWSVDTC